jgi:uncharacterized membrane protein YdfJ with MMPL/SSD domain
MHPSSAESLRGEVAPRTRILSYGLAAALALAGALCAVFVEGVTGIVLAVALASLGLGGAVLLIFLEVGLSEDHARARDDQRGPARKVRHVANRPWPSRRTPRRPG